MTTVTCYKGSQTSDKAVYDLDPNMCLSDVRTFLVSNNFIQSNTAEVEYRFVNTQSESTIESDAIIGIATENLIALRGVLGSGQQLILTNIAATSRPDLIGIGTPMFFDRFLGVSIGLNKSDPDAVAQNNSVGAFDPPLMLTNVKPTSSNVTGIYDNVCVCVEGTVISFGLSSWGAVGYSEYIAPDQGEPIVNDDLLLAMGNNPNTYAQTGIWRYSSKPQTIEIVGADTAQISPTQTLNFQRVTVRTRRMTHYEQNGQSYDSQQQPPTIVASQPAADLVRVEGAVAADDGGVNKALATAPGLETVPGDSIKPGGPVEGPPSVQNWGSPISNTQIDDPTEALGEVVIYFFVFKSQADALTVINGYNAPDPTVWS